MKKRNARRIIIKLALWELRFRCKTLRRPGLLAVKTWFGDMPRAAGQGPNRAALRAYIAECGSYVAQQAHIDRSTTARTEIRRWSRYSGYTLRPETEGHLVQQPRLPPCVGSPSAWSS